MKNITLAALLVAAVCLALLTWHQSQQIAALEQNAASILADRSALQHRLADAEQRVTAAEKKRAETETELASLRDRPAPAQTPRATTPTARPDAMAVLDNPAMQKVMAATMKSSLDQRFGGLFRQLKLSPAELDKFKDLLAERQMSSLDVMRVAQAQGINPGTSDFATLLTKAQGDVDDSIRSLVGDQRFQQYQDFNQNIASYTLLDQIERRLSYTNAPLQSSQSDALLRVLIETAQPMPGAGGPGVNAMSSFAQSMAGTSPLVAAMTSRPLSSETIARAQTVLTPAQAEVLTQIQAEQQSSANMLQSLRTNAGATSGAVLRSGSTGLPATTAPTPSR